MLRIEKRNVQKKDIYASKYSSSNIKQTDKILKHFQVAQQAVTIHSCNVNPLNTKGNVLRN